MRPRSLHPGCGEGGPWIAQVESADCGSMSGAGAEGLEPPAYGFGDRRSTN
jgi:hypothetical protein